ncbi:solute carrier family 15 member 1-like isoform X2 [Anneissia japonica]|uniref:solute carrier family 15 member 1-like isoform X2 n=1 Tax=Anneissia japonica TaxID=1529436 RepID=UPI001425AB57|nr:solute carrier family 15 member 1-like isoform X2 [Anneissia japonica]
MAQNLDAKMFDPIDGNISDSSNFSDELSPLEDSSLLENDGKPQKISGKAWGRLPKFFCCDDDFPTSVYYIVGNEFCERFSYYGMRTILIIYLTNILLLSDNNATAVFHTFTMLCYFTPLFGAMIADGFLGKYRTILYISFIYMCGSALMSLTALPPQTTGDPELIGPVIALLLIALGTGGIKPCVSAFGGDQFVGGDIEMLQKFFAVFYFTINAGSVLSTFLTPILRNDVQCFGNDCYFLAFGVPAVLMFISLIIFVLGRKKYKRFPPTGNIIGEVSCAIGYALKNRFKKRKTDITKEHWVDWADDKYDAKLLEDVKNLCHVLVMYLPLPIFWALFDQQGSRWTLQAEHMDGQLGHYRVKPDQMMAFNPILIIIMIPFFEVVVYPVIRFLRIPCRPLQRMGAGILFAGLAFVVAGFLQIRIDNTELAFPGTNEGMLKLINAAPCDIDAQLKGETNKTFGHLDFASSTEMTVLPLGNYTITFLPQNCSLYDRSVYDPSVFIPELTSKEADIAVVGLFNDGGQLTYETRQFKGVIKKPHKGNTLVSVVYVVEPDILSNMSVILKSDQEMYTIPFEFFSASAFKEITPDTYTVQIPTFNSTHEKISTPFIAESGAIYTILIQCNVTSSLNACEPIMVVHTDIYPNSVSIFWQIPQYFVITFGEILFSITGLEFSYSQAPSSMKSCVQAAWLMTVAFGNLIVVIVAESRIVSSQALEFFLFAGLTGVVLLIFIVMAVNYKYITPVAPDNTDLTNLVDDKQNQDETSLRDPQPSYQD